MWSGARTRRGWTRTPCRRCAQCSSQRVSGRGAGEELQQDLRKELLRRERKCESGSGVLPVARSAVPAGTRARLLLTYIRLVEGGRLQRDRRERVQRDAEGAPGAAQNDHKRRVERARAQSAAEGLLLPAEHGSPRPRPPRPPRAVLSSAAARAALNLVWSRLTN